MEYSQDTQDIFNNKAAKIIFEHQLEFDELIPQRKLSAVKLLKEYSGGWLKESKNAIDLYVTGDLKQYIKFERKEKLQKLVKPILIDNLIIKIKNSTDDNLKLILQNMTYDELLNIDKLIDIKK